MVAVSEAKIAYAKVVRNRYAGTFGHPQYHNNVFNTCQHGATYSHSGFALIGF